MGLLRALIDDLRGRGVVFTLGVDRRIRYAPRYAATEAEREVLRLRRDEVYRLLWKERYPPLGLIARWSNLYGYVSIHDPTLGEWWDVPAKDAPSWALNEARRRKELYRAGEARAYTLTATEMEALWEQEHPEPEEEGIIEEHPLPDD